MSKKRGTTVALCPTYVAFAKTFNRDQDYRISILEQKKEYHLLIVQNNEQFH